MKEAGEKNKPTSTDIRRDARRLLEELAATEDRERRRRLAVRAFELAQLAEQIDYESWINSNPPSAPAGAI